MLEKMVHSIQPNDVEKKNDEEVNQGKKKKYEKKSPGRKSCCYDYEMNQYEETEVVQ